MNDVRLSDLPLKHFRWRQKCVLFAVARHGPVTLARLSVILGESEKTIRDSLYKLSDAGLVTTEPDTRTTRQRHLWRVAAESPEDVAVASGYNPP